MKRVLLFTLVFTAIAAPIRGQNIFDLTVSEYQDLDKPTQHAFAGYVIGVYELSTEPSVQWVRDCIAQLQRNLPDMWLERVSMLMYYSIVPSYAGSQSTPAIQAMVTTIGNLCRFDHQGPSK